MPPFDKNMHFTLTPEQEQIKSETLAIASKLSAKDRTSRDRESRFDADGWKMLAQAGFFDGFLPEDFGGKNWDTLTKVIALEAFGYSCRDNGLALAVSSLVWTIFPPLLTFGSDEQKKRYLPQLASGNCIAADGITEEQSGSDAMAMQTLATRRNDGYLVNGEKCYIGFAPIADLILLFAKTDPNAGSWGISAFLVDANTPGIHKSDNREKMGLRTLPMGNIAFRDCLIPHSALLGSEGLGLSLFNESMEWERSFILATQVGAMARQLDSCIAFAKKRSQFGKSISEFQSISNRIADMRVRLETCRLLLYKTASLKDQGESITLESAMTKLTLSESFVASSMDAVRIHGAQGYLSEFEVERNLRDATGGLIYAGTSDIQRNLIARLCGI